MGIPTLRRPPLRVDEQPPTPQRHGAIGDGVADDTAALNAWAAAGYSEGYIPPGTYLTSTGVVQPVGMSAALSVGATLKATATMEALWQISRTAQAKRKNLVGGTFDCSNLAQTGIELGSFAEFTLTDAQVLDAAMHPVVIGVATAVSNPNSAWIDRLSIRRNSSLPLVTGAIGLWVQRATDCRINNTFVQGAEFAGVKVDVGSNRFSNLHSWGFSGGIPQSSYYDNSDDNEWIACMADTPSTYGFNLRQFRTRLIGCHSYMNGAYGPDNTATGIWFQKSAPDATVIGHYFEGGNTTHRWAKDVDAAGTGWEWYVDTTGNRWLNVVTQQLRSNSMTTQRVHATGTNGLKVRANSATGSALSVDHDSGAQFFNVNVVDATTAAVAIANGAKMQGFKGAYTTETLRLDSNTGAVTPGTATGRGGAIYSGSGAPTIAGTAGDTYHRTDTPTVANQRIYICTVTGAAGVATWVGIV